MIQNLKFVFLFLKIFFWAYNFFIIVYTCQWISSEFFLIPDFVAESIKANKNLRKRSLILQYSFSQKISLILQTSTHLTLKIICTRNAAKNLPHFTNVSASMFLFGARRIICTAPFLDVQELHSWSILKANACIFLYISLRKFLFQRGSKVLSGGGRLNNLLKAACCLDHVTIFQHLIFLSTSLED